MKNYLLLRDNKQTGPYSFDEMVNMGFKAYDLVWVEGKSAAWRYPGELEEFKTIAPIVEEQPFDRFFKKPSSSKNKSPQEKESVSQEASTPLPKIEKKETPSFTQFIQSEELKEENEAVSEKKEIAPKKFPKYVSVSLPSAKNGVSNTVKVKKAEPAAEENKKIQEQKPKVTEETKTFSLGFENTKVEKIPVSTQERNYVPVGEDQKVQYFLPEKRQAPLMQMVAVAAAILSLVAVGVLIGMSFGKGNAIKKLPEQQQLVNKNKLPNTNAAVQEPSTPNTNTEALNTSLQQQQDASLVKPEETNSLPSTVPAVNNEVKPKKQPKTDQQKEVVQPPAAQTEKPTTAAVVPAVKQDNTVSAEAIQKETARKNIKQLVSMNLNDFKVGMFGGISELQVTVNNGSSYPVDLVVVEVTYIQSNKKIFKTETLTFKNIAANSSQVRELPKTSKGIKIESRITYINSKELDLSYNVW